MRKTLLGLVLLVGVESAALACSCMAPGSPEESRAHAREVAPGIVAIVEAEAVTEYRPGTGGEQVRVNRTLFGSAPPTLRIERGEFASSASCDLLLNRGERKVLILSKGEGGVYRMQSLCSDYLASDRYLPILLEEVRRSAGAPDKAGERADKCPAASGIRAAASA